MGRTSSALTSCSPTRPITAFGRGRRAKAAGQTRTRGSDPAGAQPVGPGEHLRQHRGPRGARTVRQSGPAAAGDRAMLPRQERLDGSAIGPIRFGSDTAATFRGKILQKLRGQYLPGPNRGIPASHDPCAGFKHDHAAGREIASPLSSSKRSSEAKAR